MNIRINVVEKSLFSRVHEVNKRDLICNKYYQVIYKGESTLYKIKLNRYRVIDNILFKNKFL